MSTESSVTTKPGTKKHGTLLLIVGYGLASTGSTAAIVAAISAVVSAMSGCLAPVEPSLDSVCQEYLLFPVEYWALPIGIGIALVLLGLAILDDEKTLYHIVTSGKVVDLTAKPGLLRDHFYIEVRGPSQKGQECTETIQVTEREYATASIGDAYPLKAPSRDT